MTGPSPRSVASGKKAMRRRSATRSRSARARVAAARQPRTTPRHRSQRHRSDTRRSWPSTPLWTSTPRARLTAATRTLHGQGRRGGSVPEAARSASRSSGDNLITMDRIETMTPKEAFDLSVRAGIPQPDGTLTPEYGGLHGNSRSWTRRRRTGEPRARRAHGLHRPARRERGGAAPDATLRAHPSAGAFRAGSTSSASPSPHCWQSGATRERPHPSGKPRRAGGRVHDPADAHGDGAAPSARAGLRHEGRAVWALPRLTLAEETVGPRTALETVLWTTSDLDGLLGMGDRLAPTSP